MVELDDALERMFTAVVPMTHGPGSLQDEATATRGASAGAALAVAAETSGIASAPSSAAETAIRVERMRKKPPYRKEEMRKEPDRGRAVPAAV
ncbi:protein of unknown function [Streptomyces murinus]